ncbi:uncharacterized protein LOC124153906 isoform X2 [Ischnura elegans]|uniref:uncharacterized protein LOC124153906 isoform X2 n=1 Tax=Ischnura elegans TaxID=197161 RepID=UPI001ED89B42|nr:uncharacterized protein LOC124153906 isoform X2 [Ischnura elegans]
MDVTESSQSSSKDDKEGEVSSTCNDNRNNEERASIEVASNSNNTTSLECSESSSGLDGTSTKRSLSPDTSNALGGLMEDRENFSNPPEAEQSGEGSSDQRGLMGMSVNDNLPSVSCDASTPESNQVSDRGNSEEMLTSTTEDSGMIAQALEDDSIAISESGEENRPSSAGQNNPQEDFISVSSASNAQNSDGAGNSNIPGILDVEEELEAAVDGNVPSLPGAADSTTLELMELSEDSSSSVGENFGVSTSDRGMWQVSTTQSRHSSTEMPSSECVPSACSQSPSASTSRGVESNQPLQRECQQSDTVSATENGEGASVSTTNSDSSRSVTARTTHTPPTESNNQPSPLVQPEVNDTVSASTGENRGTGRQISDESASSCTEQVGLGGSSVTQEPARKSNDSVSSSKDCVSKVEEASGSLPNTSRNQESRIDTTTGNASKALSSAPQRGVPEAQDVAQSSFSITTSDRGRSSPGDLCNVPVSQGSDDTASSVSRLIGLADDGAQYSRSQTDSRVSTSGQHSSKGGASSTTSVKTSVPRAVSSIGESSPVCSAPDNQSVPKIIDQSETSEKIVVEPKDSRIIPESKDGPSVSHIGSSPSQPSSSAVEDKSPKESVFVESPPDSGTPLPGVEVVSGDNNDSTPSECSTPSENSKEAILKPNDGGDSERNVDKKPFEEVKTVHVAEKASSPPSCSNSDNLPEHSPKDSSSSKISKEERKPEVARKDSSKKVNFDESGKSSEPPIPSKVKKESENPEMVSEVFVTEESEVEWSEEALLIGEEVSMSAVDEALFSGKGEVDRLASGDSMEDSDSTSHTDIKEESGPLKRFGSAINVKAKKACLEMEDSSDLPCHSSMKSIPPKTDSPSTSKKTHKPSSNLEAILSAMEGSSMEGDTSSASCTPPLVDPQNSNGSGGNVVYMESIMADLLKSKMETMDADSGSDDIQIIEVIEHPRKEKPVEAPGNSGEVDPLSDRILVEIGDGGGIRVGPMQPSRGSVRTTRGLPGITVMRGSVRGRGRPPTRSLQGATGRGNQVAMRRVSGRGLSRGMGTPRGRGNGDGSPCPRGVSSPRGVSIMGPSRGLPMPTSPTRGMLLNSPRGMSTMVSPRGGPPIPMGKVPMERGSGRGVPLGRPPSRGLTSRGGRGGEMGRGAATTRGRGSGVRGMGIGGGRGSAVLGRGMPSNLGRGLSITVGRGITVERIPSGSSNCRGINKTVDMGMERSGVVISSARGGMLGSTRGISRGGVDMGMMSSSPVSMRGMMPSRGGGTVRGTPRGTRGAGRGGTGRGPGRPLGRPRGSGNRGATVAGIALSPEITIVPQEVKMPHMKMDVSVSPNVGPLKGMNMEGLTIIPHTPSVPSVVKEEDSSSHDVIVVAEVGGSGTVKVEPGSMERANPLQDEKLSVPVTVEVKMEDMTSPVGGEEPLSSKRKRKPKVPMEISTAEVKPKRARKPRAKSDEPKSKKGKKGSQKKGANAKQGNAVKNGGFSGKLPPPIDSNSKPTIQIFEEETRMSAESGSRSQTPARAIHPAGAEEEVSQGSLLSNGTTESSKKKVRLEVYDPDSNVEFTAENLAEYQWPLNDKTADHYMIQEQVSEYLGVKSFKRKYPDLKRRTVEAEEKAHLREKGLVSESLCDLGLTALISSEVLDVMFADFQEKYEEFRRVVRERQAKEIQSRQRVTITGEKNKQSDYKRRAMKSAASWNSSFNKERKEERQCCFDLQSFTIHYPQAKGRQMTRDKPKIGHYPISLIPGQYTDYYKRYTPTELRYYPLNTVLYGPMRPNEMEEHLSDGSQSESEDSSSSDDSSSSSSEATQDTEETSSTGDMETENAGGVAEGTGNKGSGANAASGPACKVCGGDRSRNKLGRPEPLIQCAQCESSGHPSCLDLTLDMVPHIKSYDWQCTDCKTCIECKDPADEDKMLFCDMCDRGYHIYCVGLRKVPSGSWHCQVCEPDNKDRLGENSNGSGVMHWQSSECKNGDREKTMQQIANPHFPKVLLSKI